MSHDLDQPPVTAPVPPATNFAFGPTSGGPRGNHRLVAVVAAVAVAGAGAFFGLKAMGGSDSEPAPRVVVQKAPAKKAPGLPLLTNDPNVVGAVLKNVAVAEESYATDANGYTTRMADLVDQGFTQDKRVTVRLISADATRFCVSAAGGGTLVVYYDSRTGRPSRTACH